MFLMWLLWLPKFENRWFQTMFVLSLYIYKCRCSQDMRCSTNGQTTDLISRLGHAVWWDVCLIILDNFFKTFFVATIVNSTMSAIWPSAWGWWDVMVTVLIKSLNINSLNSADSKASHRPMVQSKCVVIYELQITQGSKILQHIFKHIRRMLRLFW